MSFTCNYGNRGPHSHDLVIEAKICAGLVRPPAAPAQPTPYVRLATPRQIKYIRDLGGHVGQNEQLTFDRASSMIDTLLKQQKGLPVSNSASMPAPVKTDEDKKREMIAMMLQSIRDGYYATQIEDGARINYLRISRPQRNRYAGSIKIQTQHGPRLELAAAVWPSGKMTVHDYRVVDALMLLIADAKGCAMRYSRTMKRCCRCNLELTDPRSQHYGIGPECENHWPDIIEEIDFANDGKSYEQLAR